MPAKKEIFKKIAEQTPNESNNSKTRMYPEKENEDRPSSKNCEREKPFKRKAPIQEGFKAKSGSVEWH